MPDARSQDRPTPLYGAYYWVPSPPPGRLTWAVLTNQDAGLDPDTGHTTLWPWVLVQMAVAWGREPGALVRLLGDHYAGVPRGRVTMISKKFLINHGHDAPIDGWEPLVVSRFNLSGQRLRTVRDDHERMLREDVDAVAEVLGIPPALGAR